MTNDNDIQKIKQRFGVVGNSALLNRAIDIAIQVAPTDISVLITGESGTGKEVMPQIIHEKSVRKHGPYIAVNCGAIPQGTIDSELFGHEKGSFTGAHEARKGYFEEANGGTIFLDEVAELPVQTQVRLLRVLETGEFIRVGSSKVIKTDVRIVAASNVNIPEAIAKGAFREDLFYRLSTVPINMPPLRERPEDIHLLFRKFTSDLGEKYRMPPVRLNDGAISILNSYRWPGNIRQLKNVTEQLSVIETERTITAEVLKAYLPDATGSNLPMVVNGQNSASDLNEREILYKVLFDMKNDLNDLRTLVGELIKDRDLDPELLQRVYETKPAEMNPTTTLIPAPQIVEPVAQHEPIEIEESLSLEEKEKELIQKALVKHKNKRKYAADELGISERTLYRKIKEYDLK